MYKKLAIAPVPWATGTAVSRPCSWMPHFCNYHWKQITLPHSLHSSDAPINKITPPHGFIAVYFNALNLLPFLGPHLSVPLGIDKCFYNTTTTLPLLPLSIQNIKSITSSITAIMLHFCGLGYKAGKKCNSTNSSTVISKSTKTNQDEQDYMGVVFHHLWKWC